DPHVRPRNGPGDRLVELVVELVRRAVHALPRVAWVAFAGCRGAADQQQAHENWGGQSQDCSHEKRLSLWGARIVAAAAEVTARRLGCCSCAAVVLPQG